MAANSHSRCRALSLSKNESSLSRLYRIYLTISHFNARDNRSSINDEIERRDGIALGETPRSYRGILARTNRAEAHPFRVKIFISALLDVAKWRGLL